MRQIVVALVACSCIGPQIIDARIVYFKGREGFGYVTAKVMEQRTREAIALAKDFCDGGVDITGKRSEGHDNFIDFRCTGLPKSPCVESK